MSCDCNKSHDITFCEGARCHRIISCHRYINLHKFSKNDRISIANFADHEGVCDHGYWPIEIKNDESQRS